LARFAAIVQSSHDAIISKSPDGIITSWNPSAEQLFGYSAAEAIGQRVQMLMPLGRERAEQDIFAAVCRGERTASFETERRHKSGRLIKVAVSLFPIRGAEGELVGGAIIVRDLTAQKRLDFQLEAFALLGKQLSAATTMRSAALLILETASRLLAWDCSWLRVCDETQTQWEDLAIFDIVNGKRQEVAGNATTMNRLSPILRRTIQEGAQLALRNCETDEPNFETVFGSGRRSASLIFVPIRQGGRLIGLLSIQSYRENAYTTVDVATLQALADHCGGALQRIRTEATLHAKEEQLALAAHAAQIGYWDWNIDTNASTYSPEWQAQLGYGENEIAPHVSSWHELLHPEDRAAAIAKVVDYIDGKILDYESEFRLRHKDGSYRWIYSRGRLHQTEAGPGRRILGCHIDISERKRQDIQLAAFAQLGRQLGATATFPEAAGIIMQVAERLLGWDASLLLLIDEKTGLCSAVHNMDVINGQKVDVPSPMQNRPPSPQMVRTMEHGANMVLRQQGEIPGSGFFRFGDTSRVSASLLYVPLHDGPRVIGLISIQSYTYNAYTQRDLDTLQALADHCSGALGRLRSQENQRASELDLAAAQLQAKLGSWEYDFRTGQPRWSTGMHALFDQTPGAKPLELEEFLLNVHPADAAVVSGSYVRLAELRQRTTWEFRFQQPGKSLRHFAVAAECIRDAEDNAIKAVGVIQDITDRKIAEEEIAESSKRLQLALEVAHMGMWDWDLTTDRVKGDAKLVHLFAGPGDVLLQTQSEFQKYIHPGDRAQIAAAIETARAGPDSFQARFRVIWRDGSIHWLEGQGSIFRDLQGRAQRMIGVTLDITKRQNAEEALRRSERQYADLVNSIEGIVWEADGVTLELKFLSHQAERLLGSSPEARADLRTFWHDHIHPEDFNLVTTQLAAPDHQPQDFRQEFRMRTRDGKVVWVENFVTVATVATNSATLRGVMVDISRRKTLEAQQAQSFSLLQTTLDASEDGLMVVDRVGSISLYNRRFVDLWRLPEDQIRTGSSATTWVEFAEQQVHPPDSFHSVVRQLREHPEQESSDVLSLKDGRILERYSRPQRLGTEIIGRVWSFRDVTERRQNERLVLGQSKILEGIARGTGLKVTLAEVCRTVESASPGVLCTVLLLDDDAKVLRLGAAPSLPADFVAQTQEILIGPEAGACGTAAYRGQPIVCEDIATDPLWEGVAPQIIKHGLRACWSTPIFDSQQRVLGTVAFYAPVPKRPSGRERSIMDVATQLAAIAILKDRADSQLASSAQILRKLSANLLAAQESERRHLARELHDELGQTLTATKILLEGLRPEALVHNGDGNALARPDTALLTAISHVETMLSQVRQLSLGLRPPILDDCGLPAALRWLLDQHTKTTGRPVAFKLEQFDSEPEAPIATACFRIAQEAITNVARHSKAAHVDVELQSNAEAVTLKVRDDGVGFDVAATTVRTDATGGIGLLGQRERAALLGGHVEIQSRPGLGTEVLVRFPRPHQSNGNGNLE